MANVGGSSINFRRQHPRFASMERSAGGVLSLYFPAVGGVLVGFLASAPHLDFNGGARSRRSTLGPYTFTRSRLLQIADLITSPCLSAVGYLSNS